MMKRIVSAVLVCVLMLSCTLPVFAETETSVKQILYYSVNAQVALDNDIYDYYTVDFMLIPESDEVYINAEDLADLAFYDFQLSEEDCTFSKDLYGHLVYFSYNADKIVVYQSGEPISYKLPYSAKYVDEVAWVPFDFGMNILNVRYAFDKEKLNCQRMVSVFAIAHRILKGEFKFDYAKEFAVAEETMKVKNKSAAIVTLLDGLLTGDLGCWATVVFGGNVGGYDNYVTEAVCDEFVKPSKAEIDATTKNLAIAGYVVDSMSLVKGCAENGTEAIAIAEDAVRYGSIARNNMNSIVAQGLTDVCLEERNKIVKDSIKKQINKRIDKDLGKLETPEILDAAAYVIDIMTIKAQLDGADEVSVRALKRFGESTKSHVAPMIKSKADMYEDKGWADASSEFLYENIMGIVLGCFDFGIGAYLLELYDFVSDYCPGLQSAKNFAYSRQAMAMQNDAQGILRKDYFAAFAYKKIDEKNLEKVGTDCYTYLKLSIVARNFAKESTLLLMEDEAQKKRLSGYMDEFNRPAAELLNYLYILEDGGSKADNKNGAYALILPSQNKKYISALYEESLIYHISNEVGTLVKSSTIETPIEYYILLTEKQAIEMVRTYLNGFLGRSKITAGFVDTGRFECLGHFDVEVINMEDEEMFEEDYEFETEHCYIIAVYEKDKLSNIYCVATDGTGAYFCNQDADGGYSMMPELSLDSIDFTTFFDVMKKFGKMMFNLMKSEVDENSQSGGEVYSEIAPAA